MQWFCQCFWPNFGDGKTERSIVHTMQNILVTGKSANYQDVCLIG